MENRNNKVYNAVKYRSEMPRTFKTVQSRVMTAGNGRKSPATTFNSDRLPKLKKAVVVRDGGAIPINSQVSAVKLTNAHAVEITYTRNIHKKPNIVKIDKDSYCNLSTGEICTFKKSAERNETSLKRTQKKIRHLIEANLIPMKDVHITLTYKDNVQDFSKLSHDMDIFIKRLRRLVDVKFEFLYVLERQDRGALHVHLLIFGNGEKIKIDSKALIKKWQHGRCHIKRAHVAQARYLSYYLTKSNRSDYQQNKKIYRKSQGCIIPKKEYIIYKDIALEYPIEKYIKRISVFEGIDKVAEVVIARYEQKTTNAKTLSQNALFAKCNTNVMAQKVPPYPKSQN